MERTTARDCEVLLGRVKAQLQTELPDVERLIVHRESGVYRLRIVAPAPAPGTWQSDISPACMTARELWLYLRGLLDGHALVETVRFHTERDIEYLARREA